MAQVRIMYWKEIPVQVQAADDAGTVSVPLDDRFQQGVDSLAMADGSAGTDEYLVAWEWSGYFQVVGTAADAANATAARYNNAFPKDFVTRIAALGKSGTRDPSPGSVDHWIES